MRTTALTLLAPLSILGALGMLALAVSNPAAGLFMLLAAILGLVLLEQKYPFVSTLWRKPATEPEANDRTLAWTRSRHEGKPEFPMDVARLVSTRDEAARDYDLPIVLGNVKDGDAPTTRTKWIDLARAPHVLVGGSTGSGKSVFLTNAIVTATACMTPDRLRLALIDPKRVEFSVFKDMPHTVAHVSEVTEARGVLLSVIAEMERRYKVMEQVGMRDIGDTEPRIMVVIDEFADLVLTTRRTENEVEPLLARLLALGRAAGIHVILATQRPDAKVVTGLIKANAPTRVAFRTANAVESRIILDTKGAETLPGKGAGLVLSHQVPGGGKPVPFQGTYLTDAVVDGYVAAASA